MIGKVVFRYKILKRVGGKGNAEEAMKVQGSSFVCKKRV